MSPSNASFPRLLACVLFASAGASPSVRGVTSQNTLESKAREIHQARQLFFGRDKDEDDEGGFNLGKIFGGNDDGQDGGDICSIVEGLIDRDNQFDGSCECNGNIFNDLTLSCTFQNTCANGDGDLPVVISENSDNEQVCGSIDLSFKFTGLDGAEVSTCIDFEDDDYLRTCFSYQMNFVGGLPDDATCKATYGDDDCACEIEDDFCLKLDCPGILANATMDTCQGVNILDSDTQIGDLVPRFVGLFGDSTPEDNAGNVPSDPIETGERNKIDFGFWNVSVPDWINIDWEDLSWDDLLKLLNIDLPDVEVCSAFEGLIGLGEEFGIAGDCACEGTLQDGLTIGCNFEKTCQDEEQDDTCGSISVDFSFENLGSVGAAVCVDFTADEYERFCFDYSIPIADNSPPTCKATYDNKQCGCEIDGFCLSVDCSDHLEGAVTDTCQALSIADGSSIRSFFPDWKIFDFNISNIDFGSFPSLKDLIDEVPPHIPVCAVVEAAAGIADTFVTEGDCDCNGSLNETFSVGCEFPNVCNAGGDACGSIDFAVTLDNLDLASAEACIDIDGSLPEICLSYKIPIVSDDLPTCSASIGGVENQCGCSIDENLCFKLDCSEFAAGTVMDTCQTLSLEGDKVQNIVPSFRQVSGADDVDVDSEKGDDGSETDGENNDTESSVVGAENPTSGSLKLSLSAGLALATIVAMIFNAN